MYAQSFVLFIWRNLKLNMSNRFKKVIPVLKMKSMFNSALVNS